MTPKEKVDYLLGEIGKTLKMEQVLVLDHDNQCVFTVDERFGFILILDEQIEQLLINLPLGLMPPGEAGRDLAIEMLMGNYAWGLTAGATLGLDSETSILSLCHNFDVSDGRGEGFEGVLAEMIGAAAYWMDKIEETGKQDALPFHQGIRV